MTAISDPIKPIALAPSALTPGAPAPTATRTAIVAGGGIAGIAAAVRLAEAGVRVTLVETRPRLGGRASSFVDPRTGETLDNCQHVVMGCCTAYLDLLARLGMADAVTWTCEQYWIERAPPGASGAEGRTSVVRPGVLPAPFHFAGAVLGASFLTLGEKAALAWGAHMVAHARRSDWLDATFGAFLRHARQPAGLVEKFWSPIVVSACNLPCDRVCAASALMVFQDGFFGHPRAAEIGVSRVPLLRLYDRVEPLLAAAGGSVRTGFSIERLGERWVEGGASGRSERLEADAVVCALPVERALEVIEPSVLRDDPRFPPMMRVVKDDRGGVETRESLWSFSPILGVHLAFDRPVLRHPHAVLVPGVEGSADGCSTQWLFRKDEEGRRIHAVISAADGWMNLDEREIVRRVVADLHAHLPGSRGAQPTWARAIKEKRATFAATPEIERLRPSTAGPRGPEGLMLAGDYTATGWPATMEGAARSGYAAAAEVMGVCTAGTAVGSAGWRPADLAPSGLARWLVRQG